MPLTQASHVTMLMEPVHATVSGQEPVVPRTLMNAKLVQTTVMAQMRTASIHMVALNAPAT